ncbi:hypothetical protein OYC64_006740 [Pagothenia borchgrevinki]|uniref:Uncharacterized protein n=1 Tax=Pagothenia borchgrevinki TaxID=8213 RepID=A0ABD2G277_PAGBO
MGIRHILLLLIYLDPLCALGAATGGKKSQAGAPPKASQSHRGALGCPAEHPAAGARQQPRHMPGLLRRERAV